jgi:formate hydrogenlyase subunit 3/multisubunit Na+/H+ antiporter MnhD subunit
VVKASIAERRLLEIARGWQLLRQHRLLCDFVRASVSILAALLTVVLSITSVQSWRKNWWNSFTRVRYSILAFACMGMVFFLNTWNLLGFHF